ncbi:alpha/beta fold hydrolase [Pseudomonas panipatensis]|uniref:Pimeloyl-ACP methyl ester carboxylesterase n=1 Tax=Pseudomonas panipatensis TaxID=428992 RepID=A0A1G8E5D7_9PSED|nr:alpha/beta hydrolase [Pseudomonas panipatensis]SDH65142.1 Pimeloyl-ACP methyl ester carboxylesterase [Pseudomonas panipatensis]SMP38438.1 Pimeloyl-ACP methyl ester carboxylesterase [Pseudomonas panipatensis]
MSVSQTLQPPLAAGFARFGFGALPLDALIARYAAPASGSRFIEVDGFSIHYRDEGSRDRPVLVMIHGVMASLHTWDGWVAEMGRHFRIVRLDVPGFGLTGPGRDKEYSGERMVRVLGLLLDRLGLGKVSIAGNSLGGYIAWNFALAQPDRVERLILVDPAGYPMHKVPLMIASAVLPGAGLLMPAWMPRALLARGIKEVYGNPQRIQPGVVERYYDISRRPGNRRSMIDIFRVLVRVNREELHATPARVAALKVPTLLMWGERDRWISPTHVPLWQRDVPGLQVKVYPGVGHIPMEEIPQQTAADALRFLHA